MKNETDYVTDLILEWKRTGCGKSEVVHEVSKIVIDYPRLNGYFDEDLCSDFYLYFYRRMLKLIDEFEYKGLSFKALLKNTLIWQFSSYIKKNVSRHKVSHCLRYDCMVQAEAVCDSCLSGELCIEDCYRKKLGISSGDWIESECIRKRVVMLALKNAVYLEERHISKISEMTGYSPDWLAEAVFTLRLKSIDRLEKIQPYRLRSNRAFMNLYQLQHDSDSCIAEVREAAAAGIESMQKRFYSACKTRSAVAYHPTNSEIAEIMNMPKGSIDSGLYYLKRELRNAAAQDDDSD